ncbi:hypothetical protein AOC46_14170 [Listeria monocytogenes]|nr:hypothetical protein [Listeria monocytogenes]
MIVFFLLAGLCYFISIILFVLQIVYIAIVSYFFAVSFLCLGFIYEHKKVLYTKFDVKKIPKNAPQIKLNFSFAQYDLDFEIKRAFGNVYNMVQFPPSNHILFLSSDGLVTNDEFYFLGYTWSDPVYDTCTKAKEKTNNATARQVRKKKSQVTFYFYNKTKDINLATELNVASKSIVEIKKFVKYVK